MVEDLTYETPTNLRRRTERLKEVLRGYRKNYSKIVVVSHYNIVRFTLAKGFN